MHNDLNYASHSSSPSVICSPTVTVSSDSQHFRQDVRDTHDSSSTNIRNFDDYEEITIAKTRFEDEQFSSMMTRIINLN